MANIWASARMKFPSACGLRPPTLFSGEKPGGPPSGDDLFEIIFDPGDPGKRRRGQAQSFQVIAVEEVVGLGVDGQVLMRVGGAQVGVVVVGNGGAVVSSNVLLRVPLAVGGDGDFIVRLVDQSDAGGVAWFAGDPGFAVLVTGFEVAVG